MQYGKMVLVTLVALVLGLTGGAFGATQTIATFSDPVAQGPPFLFAYTDVSNNATVDGVLTGGYSGLGLTLILPFLGFQAHPDTTFTITPTIAAPVVGDPDGLRLLPAGGLGTLAFSDSSGVILSATFTQLHRTTGAAGASDSVALEFVDLFLPSGPDLIQDPETFFFSFANVTGDVAAAVAGNAATVEATAAFTSSGTPIPEPSTLALLGLGVLGLGLGQARRRAWGPRMT